MLDAKNQKRWISSSSFIVAVVVAVAAPAAAAAGVVVVVVSRYMHTSLMGVVLTSPYIPTSTLWLKE